MQNKTRWLTYGLFAVGFTIVHALVAAFFVRELLSLADSGRGMIFPDQSWLYTVGMILFALMLPTAPLIPLLGNQWALLAGGPAWAFILVGMLELGRRWRRSRA